MDTGGGSFHGARREGLVHLLFFRRSTLGVDDSSFLSSLLLGHSSLKTGVSGADVAVPIVWFSPGYLSVSVLVRLSEIGSFGGGDVRQQHGTAVECTMCRLLYVDSLPQGNTTV